MVIENELPPFWEWLPGALGTWALACLILAVAVVLLSLLFGMVVSGPAVALRQTRYRLAAVFKDLVLFSPRRALALAGLAMRESIRRRVLVVFVLYVLILLFAAWFLDPADQEAARTYLSFVLFTSAFLVLVVMLLLSALSLPADIAGRTVYTVVTKPVRTSEIVLGRIIGFTAIGTMLLALMSVVSYIFVVRAFDHRHEIDPEQVREVKVYADTGDRIDLRGETNDSFRHRHQFSIRKGSEHGVTDMPMVDTPRNDEELNPHRGVVQGHWHKVTRRERNGEVTYEVGPPEGQLVARIPVYALPDNPAQGRYGLTFLDRNGTPTLKGINVGNEWTYRTYIEGQTGAAAIWHFSGITPERFPNGLPLQMTLRVFRTHKGTITEGINGSIRLVNPKNPNIRSTFIDFRAKEYSIYEHFIPRTVRGVDPNNAANTIELDLFAGLYPLVEDGELKIEIRCNDRAQYFGMAKPDLYIMAAEGSFLLNFAKGYFGIWMQLVLIISLAVMFSTFLNGAVAILAAAAGGISGYFTRMIEEIAAGPEYGGGPIESFYRIITRRPMATELEPSLTATVVQSLDYGIEAILGVVARMLPNLGGLSDADWVTSGFNVPGDVLLIQFCTVIGFAIPLYVLGHYILRGREVAA